MYHTAMTNQLTNQELRFFILMFALFSTFFGACVGSFLNVCIHRIPRDESVVKPRSHCPHCNIMIPWYLNIPVLSWLALRGKCAQCKGRIAFRYTLVELLTAMLFLAVYMAWAMPTQMPVQPIAKFALVPIYWLILSGFVLGAFVDFEHFIIPDSVTIGGMIVGPVLSALYPVLHGQEIWWRGLMSSSIGLLAGFGILFAIAEIGTWAFKKEAMGFGDVKLMGAIGAFLGWKAVLFTVFASATLGSIVGIALMLSGKAEKQSQIPFGPYICAGATIWMFWGQQIFESYMKLVMRG